MFDLIDCLAAEMVPGYKPRRPPQLWREPGGGSCLQPEEPKLWDGQGRGGSSCPELGAVAGTPHPGQWHPACDVPERIVHDFSPVLTAAFALPEALWIPQTSRNDTKHSGDIWCVVVYSKLQASPLISRVGMP